MIEVEVKIPLKDIKDTEQRLINAGFSQVSMIRERDIYFTSEFHDFKALDEAMRIRTIEDCYWGGQTSVITFKGAKLDKISMSRPEYETSVGDDKTAIHILESIGFKSVPAVDKLRKILKRDNIEACLDTVTNLGDFLELEIMAYEDQKDTALETIYSLMTELGFSENDTVTNSYLSMLCNERD